MNFHRIAARRSARVGAGVAVIAAIASAGVSSAPASYAAPSTTPTPSAPKVLFAENFENVPAGTVRLITGYTGTGGMTYSADSDWTVHCNGDIVDSNITQADIDAAPVSDCQSPGDGYATGASQPSVLNNFKALTTALGVLNGENAADAANNHALSAYTEGANPAPGIQMQTLKGIPLGSGGRFIALSVDGAAVNCARAAAPAYRFLAGPFGGTLSTVGNDITGCTGTNLTENSISVNVKSYLSSSAALITSSSLGAALYNTVATGGGNDGAVDNFKVLDVSPTLSKSFSTAEQLVGKTTQLTFTVTNTTDLLAKNGWGFVDHLPKGLTVADSTVGGTCKVTSSGVSAGSTAITVTNGQLAQGASDCTVTFDVTSNSPATYTNGPGNVETTGLNAPAPVKTTFVKPSLSITKAITPTTISAAGQVLHVTFVVKNTGNVALTNVKVTDTQDAPAGPLTSGPTCPRTTLAIGASMTCMGTYTATAADVAKGSIKDSAVATADGAVGSAAAGAAASSAAATAAVAVVPAGPSVPAGGSGVDSHGSSLSLALGLALGGSTLAGAGIVVARRRMSN